MSAKRGLLLGLIVVGLGSWLSTVAIAAPWDNLLVLNRVEADPDKSYRLTEENGPWMIMACSFSGQKAAEQAKELVLELRNRYKLEAYVYDKTFDHTKGGYGRGIDRFGNPLPLRYRRGAETHEYAVLVGNHPAVDDPESQKSLKKVKYCRPDCLELDESRPTARNLAGLRVIQRRLLKPGNEKKKKGPMGTAFITTNPILPKEYFSPTGIDKFVVEINKDNKYNLLDCPGKYTVQVACFTGNVVIDQRKIQDIKNGKPMKNRLAEAGEKAKKLCEALRVKGYQAYVLHERYASIVTVGSFDSVGTPRPDGKIEINPKMHAIIETFRAEKSGPHPTNRTDVLNMQPKTLVGIPFELQPKPVMVPRRSIASDYARGAFGMR